MCQLYVCFSTHSINDLWQIFGSGWATEAQAPETSSYVAVLINSSLFGGPRLHSQSPCTLIPVSQSLPAGDRCYGDASGPLRNPQPNSGIRDGGRRLSGKDPYIGQNDARTLGKGNKRLLYVIQAVAVVNDIIILWEMSWHFKVTALDKLTHTQYLFIFCPICFDLKKWLVITNVEGTVRCTALWDTVLHPVYCALYCTL